MKIIKTLLPQNFNHKVYPLDNAVSSTFTHTIGMDKVHLKSILVLTELTSDLFYPYEHYSWDLQSQRLGFCHLFVCKWLKFHSPRCF